MNSQDAGPVAQRQSSGGPSPSATDAGSTPDGSTLHGAAALEAFQRADRLVKAGKYDEALQVPLRKSDHLVIRDKIAERLNGGGK